MEVDLSWIIFSQNKFRKKAARWQGVWKSHLIFNVVQRRSIEENTETISKIFPDISTGKGYFTEKKRNNGLKIPKRQILIK